MLNVLNVSFEIPGCFDIFYGAGPKTYGVLNIQTTGCNTLRQLYYQMETESVTWFEKELHKNRASLLLCPNID